MWEKKCQEQRYRLEDHDQWDIVKNLKTNNTSRKHVINMGRLAKLYRTLLTESKPEYIKEEKPIYDTDELLEMNI